MLRWLQNPLEHLISTKAGVFKVGWLGNTRVHKKSQRWRVSVALRKNAKKRLEQTNIEAK